MSFSFTGGATHGCSLRFSLHLGITHVPNKLRRPVVEGVSPLGGVRSPRTPSSTSSSLTRERMEVPTSVLRSVPVSTSLYNP